MKKELQKLLEENQGTITEFIINEALEQEDIKAYFEDILKYGCKWWTVPSMIYTTDVHKFYDKFYNEIEDLRICLQDDWILWIESIDQDIKTYYSWLAYEHKVYEIYSLINEDF